MTLKDLKVGDRFIGKNNAEVYFDTSGLREFLVNEFSPSGRYICLNEQWHCVNRTGVFTETEMEFVDILEMLPTLKVKTEGFLDG